jgi:hypothetical protein
MISRHITLRGRPIDYNILRAAHGSKKAVGNASVNARGDIINKSGVVLKTQEQIEADFIRKQAAIKASTSVDIKRDPAFGLMGDKKTVLDEQNFEPTPVPPPPVSHTIPTPSVRTTRRRIVDSDV